MKTRELSNNAEEKWTKGAIAEIYIAVLPTDSPAAYLNNIIFNYSIGVFSKIYR